ncbi:7886_t:CDS:2 [Funneliformis mosseae]|uniref:7886_t:CDS:1 n=1 Tax=Funneliformis mosseae TaxID=27381 RepID=A0A9N9CBN9_FUNMO|nr:7886_t:CDS:2 [Funneliformis mosseae]
MSTFTISGTPIVLWCWVRGSTSIFDITVGRDNRVSKIKEVIKERKPNDFAKVDADRLKLLKLKNPVGDGHISDIQNFTFQDNGDENDNVVLMKDMRRIVTYWPENQAPPEDLIHVIVEAPATEELRAQLEALKLGRELGYDGALFQSDLPLESEIKRIKREKEYREPVNIGLKAKPPSSGAKPSTFFTTQINNPILNGRPLELTGPPISIYNRNFTQFLEDFNNMELEVPHEILEWVMDIISASADRYLNEDGRMKKMREILSKKFGTIALTSYGKGCQCDGLLMAKVGLLDACIGIIEGKNEIGSGGTDPSLQGSIYYRDYWSQTVVKQIRDCCCVPSFIITIAGPWICIFGGIFLNRVVVQPLTDIIPLTINVRNEDQMNRIARLFQALRLALVRLGNFYNNLDLTLLRQVEQRHFPYLRSFKLDNKNVNFIYIKELEDDHTRNIWKARTMNMENNYDIVVKFVKNYNMTAHNICSGKGYSPKLLYQSSKNEFLALGKYRMIIMEFVGISLDRKLNQREIRSNNIIYDDVKFAIELLHSNNYVFADLRLPNILVYDENEIQRAMLIDFDWCGKHGVDKYPSSLNISIQWPTNVKPGTFLMKEHDIYWLGKLQERLSQSIDLLA